MNQDDLLKAGFHIHWFYSGRSTIPFKGMWLYHHGHGPVRTVKLEIDEGLLSPDDVFQITDELVNDLEERWKRKVEEHVKQRRNRK